MSNAMVSNKLQAKDLINVGIFTAIYLVLYFAAMMLGYIPIFNLLLTIICPVVCGIPFMLYLTKVQKFGMVTLTGIVLGIIFLVMGSGLLVFGFGIVFGFLGDLIMKAGDYRKWKFTMLGYSVFSIWTVRFLSRIFLTRDEFLASTASGYGQEYADTIMELTPWWTFPILIVLCFIGGVIGAYLGKTVLKKHFERAGIV